MYFTQNFSELQNLSAFNNQILPTQFMTYEHSIRCRFAEMWPFSSDRHAKFFSLFPLLFSSVLSHMNVQPVKSESENKEVGVVL